ncbi:MAG: glycosyltransferase family 2 protein [Anaerolineae bacterium]|nr:glycosyltransferase family 2 protein [Anaerolineae bacterium]
MKLIIQIPCLNEADSLPGVLADLPRELPGIDEIEILVIDDGSTDGTAAAAQLAGAHHIVRHKQWQGLARAFQSGLDTALHLGADVIINTDADNQYPGRYIADLVRPLIAGEADIVIGDRQVHRIPHFSPVKKLFQKVGSWVIRNISGTDVPDAVSGFRAYSREAALRLTILSPFSYTLESIIQAGKLGLKIVSVPIETNETERPSRLQRNMWHFMKSQASTILRVYAFYEPLRTFGYISLPFLLVGSGTWLRFLYFVITAQSGIARYAQSLIIGSGLFIAGVLILLFGIQADIASKHRRLTQEVLYRLKKSELAEKLPTDLRRNL